IRRDRPLCIRGTAGNGIDLIAAKNEQRATPGYRLAARWVRAAQFLLGESARDRVGRVPAIANICDVIDPELVIFIANNRVRVTAGRQRFQQSIVGTAAEELRRGDVGSRPNELQRTVPAYHRRWTPAWRISRVVGSFHVPLSNGMHCVRARRGNLQRGGLPYAAGTPGQFPRGTPSCPCESTMPTDRLLSEPELTYGPARVPNGLSQQQSAPSSPFVIGTLHGVHHRAGCIGQPAAVERAQVFV